MFECTKQVWNGFGTIEKLSMESFYYYTLFELT